MRFSDEFTIEVFAGGEKKAPCKDQIGVTGLEPATTRPPDEHSTTELHPVTL